MHGPSGAACSRVSVCRHVTHVLGPGHVMHRVTRCIWAETPGSRTGLGTARGRVRAQGGLSHNNRVETGVSGSAASGKNISAAYIHFSCHQGPLSSLLVVRRRSYRYPCCSMQCRNVFNLCGTNSSEGRNILNREERKESYHNPS